MTRNVVPENVAHAGMFVVTVGPETDVTNAGDENAVVVNEIVSPVAERVATKLRMAEEPLIEVITVS